jgi:hypothetical protein
VYAVHVEVWPTCVVVGKDERLVFEIASGDTQGSGIFLHDDTVDRQVLNPVSHASSEQRFANKMRVDLLKISKGTTIFTSGRSFKTT